MFSERGQANAPTLVSEWQDLININIYKTIFANWGAVLGQHTRVPN